jgi:hypothetical protein
MGCTHSVSGWARHCTGTLTISSHFWPPLIDRKLSL